MLFSHPEVAALVRDRFVAAWESVRPVPTATIDFGDGRVLTRTLNGNVATYVCAPDGRVIDVLPGLFEPETFAALLRDALATYEGTREDLDAALPAHHRALAEVPAEVVPALPRVPDVGKAMVERPIKKRLTADEELLRADSLRNLAERRPLVHRMLSERVFRPAEITGRLYRDVLHVDLDDPWLGLVSKAFEGGAYGER